VGARAPRSHSFNRRRFTSSGQWQSGTWKTRRSASASCSSTLVGSSDRRQRRRRSQGPYGLLGVVPFSFFLAGPKFVLPNRCRRLDSSTADERAICAIRLRWRGRSTRHMRGLQRCALLGLILGMEEKPRRNAVPLLPRTTGAGSRVAPLQAVALETASKRKDSALRLGPKRCCKPR
jgi:hypothetical protein